MPAQLPTLNIAARPPYSIRPLTLAIGSLLAIGVSQANAATITVDTAADDNGAGCTLREAVISANNNSAAGNGCADGNGADEIIFDNSLLNAVITLTNGLIPIADNAGLTLTGLAANNPTVDAGGNSGIFGNYGGALQIENLTLTGGNSPASGGAIYSPITADITLVNSTLSNNTATGYGGGIAAVGNQITVTSSTISDNNAGAFGGGVDSIYANIDVIDSTITDNTASYFGGGVNTYYGNFTASNSTITGNTSTNASGGGIAAGGSATLLNSIVSGNTADFSGGGAYSYAVTITNSTLQNNTASNYKGGAIYAYTTAAVTNSTLLGNAAPVREGGAIYAYDDVQVTDSLFTGNSAGDDGGAINSEGNVTINGSMFSGNSVTDGDGGAINAELLVTIIDSTLSGNTTSSDGGAVYTDADLVLTNSTISGNSAGDAGGGLYVQTGPVTITFSTIVNNTAVVAGGGVYVDDGNLNLNNSIITANNAPANAQFRASGTVVDDNNLIDTNAQLGTLANNGGPSVGDPSGVQQVKLTHLPLPGSPAIDTGTNCPPPNADERGVTRPLDGDLNGAAVCDIGAVEAPELAPGNQGPKAIPIFSPAGLIVLISSFGALLWRGRRRRGRR